MTAYIRIRFAWGLGMQLVAKSDHSTGNSTFASYVLRSNDLVFTFTAPYGTLTAGDASTTPQPWFTQDTAFAFLQRHGLGVRAIGASLQRGHHPSTPHRHRRG